MTPKITQENILEEARAKMRLSKNEFASLLGISRTSLYNWLAGYEIDVETLQVLALEDKGAVVGAMAEKLIRLQKPRLMPCSCVTAIGDRGYCPRHSGVLAVTLEQAAVA